MLYIDSFVIMQCNKEIDSWFSLHLLLKFLFQQKNILADTSICIFSEVPIGKFGGESTKFRHDRRDCLKPSQVNDNFINSHLMAVKS